MTEVSVEVKAEFLYHIFQDWRDGIDYQDEPINTILRTEDITLAICDLFIIDLLDVTDPDYAFYVNATYDRVFPIVNGGVM
jgi:hypothetical protein